MKGSKYVTGFAELPIHQRVLAGNTFQHDPVKVPDRSEGLFSSILYPVLAG